MKVKWSVSLGLVGCKRTGVMEFDDDEGLTDDEIDQLVFEDILQNEVEWNWSVVESE